MSLKFHSFQINIWASLKEVFLLFKRIKNLSFFEQAENQNDEDGTHQISFKIN